MIRVKEFILTKINEYQRLLESQMKILIAHDPEKVLKQGYAILDGKISLGNVVKITTFEKEIKAEVKEINERQ